MNVWKFSSRWSADGNADSSVLQIFRKYGIVFAYNIKPDDVSSLGIENKVKEGDLIAVADGFNIVAISKALSNAKSIGNFVQAHFEDDIKKYCGDDNVIAVKVKFVDLSEKDKFYYQKMGRFHGLHNEERNKIHKLWETQNKTFSINAKTATLKYNSQNGNAIIFEQGAKYTIPIYQRPYSWTEDQIKKFISDIFLSYWGVDKKIIEEPMFIGTIQLSEKKLIDSKLGTFEQEVVDGQQRLSTFLILIKVLSLKFPDCQELKDIDLNCLKTRVNNGEQQTYFKDMLKIDILNYQINGEETNIYLKNAIITKNILEENLSIDDDSDIIFDINDFSKHLLSNIYFVVIETLAGLSKTLQIFNAINTTGLDLNGSDIFKIRMYEYLRDKKNADENAFTEISNLYQKIDIKNKEYPQYQTNMQQILRIYQQILISKYNMSNVLFSFGTDTFFERLFDTLLNINQWEYYKNLHTDFNLNLEDIDKIIDIWYSWKAQNPETLNQSCAINFIWDSRYAKHWYSIFVFLYKFGIEKESYNKLHDFTEKLSKLYIVFSVLHDKKINEIDSFSYFLNKDILYNNLTFEEIIKKIHEKIKGRNEAVENILKNNIFYNAKKKVLLCRLSAMLDENNLIEAKTNLFNTSFDIEHIQAYNHQDENQRKDIWEKWGQNINSIGNLVMFESSKNRSVSNKPFSEKKKEYDNSIYKSVKKLCENNNWDLEDCLKRQETEIKKLINYLFIE